MATLRDIKLRIRGVKSTSQITSAMKMVAAAKLRRAQNAIESARPYFEKLDYILSNLVSSLGEDYSHPLLQKRSEINNVVVVIITSDRGLCGGFNNSLLKLASYFIENKIPDLHPGASVRVVPVGKKAVQYFRKTNDDVISEHQDIFANMNFDSAQKIVDAFKNDYISGNVDKVYVYNNDFVNIIKQEPVRRVVLPIEQENTTEEPAQALDYIFEPDKKGILDNLLPKLVDIKIWRAMLESNAAEQAARMMAMDNATRNAKDLIKELELEYNKARQAAITTEMLEIVGGANALKQG
jgi:F-type H+-transporting ATPase subunit gamma